MDEISADNAIARQDENFGEENGTRDGLMRFSTTRLSADEWNRFLRNAKDDSRFNNNNGDGPDRPTTGGSDFGMTLAGVAGNVLEWYDFAVFGYFDEVIGEVFFPPNQGGDSATIEAFAVFGGAFLMRPIGGMLMGYIGDVYGRKKALVVSIFLMAFPTFLMGCLPSYERVGYSAIVLLIIVRLLQGLSVGGQLMSSLVFTLENHDPKHWGLYGSFVMAAANFGTLLGGIAAFILNSTLTEEQLKSWGWRIPFLSGILVSLSGCYLRSHGEDHVGSPSTNRHVIPTVSSSSGIDDDDSGDEQDGQMVVSEISNPNRNPFWTAFARENRRSLAASAMVPMLWSGGFYLSFVWMAIYMNDLIENPIPGSFGLNSAALFISVCLFFPFAGILSDWYGRRIIMTIGGVCMCLLGPILVILIGRGHPGVAFGAQTVMGIFISLWGAPMCAWLAESFEPEARLTSVAVGYNVAQCIVGGSTPAFATWLVDTRGPESPGWIVTLLAAVALSGLWLVAPAPILSANNSTFATVPTGNIGTDRELEMVETSTAEAREIT